jgi:hypothetical protein
MATRNISWLRARSKFSPRTICSIIPFMPDGWAQSAGGFPAMVGNVAFLMKDVVLLAVSFYLLKQDLVRAAVPIEVGTRARDRFKSLEQTR